ncbi:MAG: hypothetical protein JWL74_879 [Alphaproteobacteria bacterium]|nr:hypothetical protein [Alphaproteobacteria bacterium]
MSLAGCEATRSSDENQTDAGNGVAAPAPLPLPAPEPLLGRERLLLAVAQARSSYAAGIDDRAAQAELDGDRFEFRIRFGCGEPPAEAAGNPSVRHDADAASVEVNAATDVSLEDPAVAATAGEGVEAVEGIWIAHPWLLLPACVGGTAASTPHTVGIAQYFTPADSRVTRRGERSYRHVVRLTAGQDPARPQGYDLLLTGRLRAGPAGRVIRCASGHPNAMPVCLIGAEFERVRIEDVERSATLAEWSRG